MIVNKMTVDGNEYFLDAEQDVNGAKDQVVDAVQHGGGIVEVLVAGHTTVAVVVSQKMPVTFEEIVPEQESREDMFTDDFWRWADLEL